MLHAVIAVSTHRARPRRLARRRGGQGASRRRRGDDARPTGRRSRTTRTTRSARSASASTLLQNDRVRYANQPIAVVIAETLEAATEGARLLAPALRGRAGAHRPRRRRALRPPAVGVGAPADVRARRHRGRPRRRDAPRSRPTYETPAQYHNAMEPHAIVAAWDGDRLTLDTPNQALAMAQRGVCRPFRHPAGERPASAAPSSAAASAPRRSSTARRSSASSPPAWSAGRSSWCCRATRCTARSAIAAPTRQTSAARHGRRGPPDGARPPRRVDDQQLRRLLRAGRQCLAHSLRQPGHLDPARRRARSTSARPARCARPARRPARPRSNARSTRRPQACGIDPLEFRLRNYAEIEPGIRQAVLVQGAARMLRRRAPRRFGWAGRARWRRARCATRTGCLVGWGMGTRHLPVPDVPGRGPRHAARATAPALVETAGADMGQGAWTALAQIAADGLGLDIDQRRVPLRHLRPAGRRHRRRLRPYRHGGHARSTMPARTRSPGSPNSPPPTRARRSSAPAMPASMARDGRLHRRDDESRSESYADILARAGVRERRGQRQRRPAIRRAPRRCAMYLAWRGLRRGEGRSRSRPDPGDAARRRLRRRPDHQPAAGAQPVSTAA